MTAAQFPVGAISDRPKEGQRNRDTERPENSALCCFRALISTAVGYPIDLAALGHFSTGLPNARAQCCALGPIAHGRAPSR